MLDAWPYWFGVMVAVSCGIPWGLFLFGQRQALVWTKAQGEIHEWRKWMDDFQSNMNAGSGTYVRITRDSLVSSASKNAKICVEITTLFPKSIRYSHMIASVDLSLKEGHGSVKKKSTVLFEKYNPGSDTPSQINGYFLVPDIFDVPDVYSNLNLTIDIGLADGNGNPTGSSFSVETSTIILVTNDTIRPP